MVVYKMMYAAAPLLRGLPAPVTSTEAVGRAMLAVAKHGSSKKILTNPLVVCPVMVPELISGDWIGCTGSCVTAI